MTFLFTPYCLSIIINKLLSTCLCIKAAVFQCGFHAPFILPTSILPSHVISFASVSRSRISLCVLGSRKTNKLPTHCAPNCLLTESINPGYSIFTLLWDYIFKLNSWLKKLKLIHPPLFPSKKKINPNVYAT